MMLNEQDRKQLELAESYICKAGEILHALYATTPQTKPVVTKGTTKINNTEVPAEIAGLAHIAEGDGLYVLTRPFDRSEQGKSNWVAINDFVKGIGGKWVSAGKDSRWEIPKK